MSGGCDTGLALRTGVTSGLDGAGGILSVGTDLLGTGKAVRTGFASCLGGTEGFLSVGTGTGFFSTGLAVHAGGVSHLNGAETMLSAVSALFLSISRADTRGNVCLPGLRLQLPAHCPES